MINLLTEEKINEVRRMYRRRFFVSALIAVNVVSFISIAALLPSFIFVANRRAINEAELNNLKSISLKEENKTLSEEIKNINNRVSILKPVASERPATELISRVLIHRPDGVLFKEITYSKTSGKENIFVRGFAADRRSALLLKETLEKSSEFEVVNLPISDLIKDREFDFTLSLVAAEGKKN